MKEIPLTNGKIALVDDDDYEWLSQWKWYSRKHRNSFYAQRSIWENGKIRTLQMHIAIMGKREGLQIDHMNGNGLDNQRHNLRHLTNRQNAQNLHTNKSSTYPGVHWDKTRHKWKAEILLTSKPRKRKFLGRFENELDAFNAYKEAVQGLGELMVV